MAVNKDQSKDSTKDPFEEFEFRPINEGLGFHRKQKNNFSISSTSLSNSTTSISSRPGNLNSSNNMGLDLASTSTSFNQNITPKSSNTNFFEAPLPRHDSRTDSSKKSFSVPTIEDDSIAKAQTAVNQILKNLNNKRQTDFIYETEKQKTELKKSKPFFLAATLDAMLISAVFLISMIAMLSVTKVDLFLNLSHAESSRFVYIATIGLFLTVTFIYMVISRSFSGCTPGEWAFDQHCGGGEIKMNALIYVPRVVLRTLLVMITGFITLPTLSYFLNKDLAGEMSGISLFIKPNSPNASNS